MVEPPHTHAVLQLGKLVVKFGGRHFPFGGQVPLIAGIYDAAPVFGAAFLGKFFQNVQRFGSGLRIVRGQLVQPLAVVGHAGRHGGDAAHLRAQRQQIV